MKELNQIGKDEYKVITETFDSIKGEIPYEPDIAVVLGTGLGNFVKMLVIDKVIDYDKIKNFPKTTNTLHKGQYVFGRIGDVKVVCMEGRIHYYDGYDLFTTMRPIRILRMMGVKKIILTNASGGINKDFNNGDLMLIKDHISLFVPEPLVGLNIDEMGERFPDMSEPYCMEFRKIVKKIAKQNKIDLKEGVFVETQGPAFETAAEIKLLSKLGADAVAMSLAIDAIVAVHCGMKVCGITMISNMATGLNKKKQSVEEVKMNAEKFAKKFCLLLSKIIPEIAKVSDV